ncbi:MAG: GWxTD domain-containing protein, partial [bacterium]
MNTKIIARFIICTIMCYGALDKLLALNETDLYQQGMELRDSGNWEEALKIWLTAKDSSGAQSQPDPRIGMAFIELATQKQATDYYEQASKIYFWGFAQKNINQYKKEIHQEIERIAPLLSKEESALWFKYLDRGDAGLLNKIKGFWIKKDPIPTSEINERLIEHWERIAFAKEKFNVENTTVYATDDRGLVFVKYGAPDKKYTGKLGI